MKASMATSDYRMREVDAVVVGLGWSGSIMAAELTKAGLSVVGIERGPDRGAEDAEYTRKHDELRYKVRNGLMQDAALETWTLRHDTQEMALPMRYLGAFRTGTGVGGASVHFGGSTFRYAPWDFQIRSRTIDRFGSDAIPDGSTIQDWGITYDELEAYYDKFEYAAGVAGTAGNIKGTIQNGGNPFEGPRGREYPLRPPKQGETAALFRESCQRLGYHPFPMPVAILTDNYINPDGISRGACKYCGDCEFYTCAVDAKGDARVTVLPVARKSKRFELRAQANVFRVLHDGKRATGVLYYDDAGKIVEQPAAMVILGAYTFNNVRLLLLSGMGEPYDPVTGKGVVGKNYGYNVRGRSTAFFQERKLKKYMGAAAAGTAIDDFTCDNFDRGSEDFIGGAQLTSVAGGAPITTLALPAGTPAWGQEWKQALRTWYDRGMTVTAKGNVLAYRTNYLDLDPVYRDAWGDPLLRITFDWHENERKIVSFAAKRLEEILTTLGPDRLTVGSRLSDRFDTVQYQNSHNTGGAIMGSEPESSVVNSFMQMWDFENVWVVGGSAFPQTGAAGPTGTICALAYRAAEGIAEKYARTPGSLV